MTKRSLAAAALVLLAQPALAASPVATTYPLDLPELSLGSVAFPGGKTLDLTVGLGSGAFHSPGDAPGTFWTITDRGPNIDCGDAEKIAGLDADKLCAGDKSSKVFPLPGFAPTIFKLAVGDDGKIAVVERIALKDRNGKDITGLPNPLKATNTENGYDPTGKLIPADPSGLDTEALVRLADGTFWVAEEYGPSLVHVAADGRIIKRLLPAGLEKDLAGAGYDVEGTLPAILMKRRLNRGVESLALMPDGKTLAFLVQSPLANPDEDASKASPNVRLVTVDTTTGMATGEYLYAFDDPTSFRADNAKKPAKLGDVKISEVLAVGDGRLLVLERVTKTTKFFLVDLNGAATIPAAFDDATTSPTLEQAKSGDGGQAGLVPLTKTLVLDSDDVPGMPEKIESMAMAGPNELWLVNDNDFAIAGDKSVIVRVVFAEPVLK